jgi:hypothetical protein
MDDVVLEHGGNRRGKLSGDTENRRSAERIALKRALDCTGGRMPPVRVMATRKIVTPKRSFACPVERIIRWLGYGSPRDDAGR